MRHVDRGWHEPEEHQFDRSEYVFGTTAAAALYRRDRIEDISIRGEFSDPDFFVYREDADVAWRAMLMGWRHLYTQAATAYPIRTANPSNRRSLPAMVNMHSLKHRFLMRIKNVTAGVHRRYRERLKGKRDRALLSLLLACGLRRHKFAELTFGQSPVCGPPFG